MPHLALVPGSRPRSAASAVEERDMELAVIRDEARAHCARMRLALQRRFWEDEVFAAVRRPLLAELERYERQIVGGGKAA